MIRTVAAILACAGLGACVSTQPEEDAQTAAAPQTPDAAAEAFYAAQATLPAGGGVPDAAGQALLAPLITAELQAKLAAAAAAEEAHTIATDNQEPPYIQGHLFSSTFEGVTSWQVGECIRAGSGANCPVALTYTDASGTSEWTDNAVMIQEDGTWKLADIVYGADWEFGNTGRLTGLLDSVAEEG